MQSAGFPNLFTINQGSVGNFVRTAEPLVDWITEAMHYVKQNNFSRMSASPEAEEEWTKHVAEAGAKILRSQADSWYVGPTSPARRGVCSPRLTPPP